MNLGAGKKIVAVMSCPRLAFTDNLFCAMSIFPPMGIAMLKHSGAYWEQSMTKCLQYAVEGNYDYVFTLDYDTIFTKEQVMELVNLMETSDADAIFPLQVKRESAMYLTNVDASELLPDGTIDTSKKLIRAITGHFGLTIIRVSSLARMPQPWLWSRPNPETLKWDEMKTDADIAFWEVASIEQKWHIYLAPHVKIGHLQNVIYWPDKQFKVKHQFLSDFEKNGLPEECK